MAIYEQGYRPYLGPRQRLSSRPWVIAAHAIRDVWKRRAVKIILVGGLFVVIGSAIFLYLGWQAVGFAQKEAQEQVPWQEPGGAAPALSTPDPAGEAHDIDAAQWEQSDTQIAQGSILSAIGHKPSLGFAILYQWTMLWEGVGVFLLAMAVLCGLVANDRKSGAIPLYLTRSVTRMQYVWGKLLAAFFLCAFLLVVPTVILGVLDFGFSLPGHGLEVLRRVGGALAASLLWSGLIGATVIAVSTLTPRPRLAAVFCALAAFLPLILATMLQEIFYSHLPDEGYWIFDVLSPIFLALQTANWFLDSPVMFNGSIAKAKFYEPLLLIAWIFLLVAFVSWRVRRLGETRE